MEVFVYGCGGAFAAEVLHWAALRKKKNFPSYWRSPFYWIVTVLLVLLGGVVAHAWSVSLASPISIMMALVVGFSAPALLKMLSRAFVKSATLGVAEEGKATFWTFMSG